MITAGKAEVVKQSDTDWGGQLLTCDQERISSTVREPTAKRKQEGAEKGSN